ncbi:hypothetical protein GR11A_00185 [Vibrio phage vB_VcorM_GR11A]|nr:hypothetical protein GR11A_00185 [Vibrio phage vB_VcorM_GR11A]
MIDNELRQELQLKLDACTTLEDLMVLGDFCKEKSKGALPDIAYPEYRGTTKQGVVNGAPYDRVDRVPLIKALRHHTGGLPLKFCKEILDVAIAHMPVSMHVEANSPGQRFIAKELWGHVNHPLRIATRIVHLNKEAIDACLPRYQQIGNMEVINAAHNEELVRILDKLRAEIHSNTSGYTL